MNRLHHLSKTEWFPANRWFAMWFYPKSIGRNPTQFKWPFLGYAPFSNPFSDAPSCSNCRTPRLVSRRRLVCGTWHGEKNGVKAEAVDLGMLKSKKMCTSYVYTDVYIYIHKYIHMHVYIHINVLYMYIYIYHIVYLIMCAQWNKYNPQKDILYQSTIPISTVTLQVANYSWNLGP